MDAIMPFMHFIVYSSGVYSGRQEGRKQVQKFFLVYFEEAQCCIFCVVLTLNSDFAREHTYLVCGEQPLEKD